MSQQAAFNLMGRFLSLHQQSCFHLINHRPGAAEIREKPMSETNHENQYTNRNTQPNRNALFNREQLLLGSPVSQGCLCLHRFRFTAA